MAKRSFSETGDDKDNERPISYPRIISAEAGPSSIADATDDAGWISHSEPQQSDEGPSQPVQPVSAGMTTPYPTFGNTSKSTMLVSGQKMNVPWTVPAEGFPGTMNKQPHTETKRYSNAFSPSGFNVLQLLIQVGTRPNPEIDIGNIDANCAFVVCDPEKEDYPIVYCSPGFEALTGYASPMVLGRNCRFLQSPDGIVTHDTRRDSNTAASLKYLGQRIEARREARVEVVNYRKGGKAFINLVTVIPICDGTTNILVGFQGALS